MSDWSDDWYRDQRPGRPAGPEAGAGAPGWASEPTVGLPAGGAAQRASHGMPVGGPAQAGPPPGGWPAQPPVHASPGRGRPGAPAGPVYGRGTGRRGFRPRRILKIIALVVVVVLVLGVGLYFYLDSKLTRINVLTDYSGRPAAAAGTNWLITGSDSRQGLTRKEERKLRTGFDVSGQRSDTIMVLHIPANGGRSVLVSLPRDSYVPIPGYGSNKINAAYAFGGAKLLAQTVQGVTGLRIDHYMSIGFGGLVNVVNAVGGVHMCLPTALDDPASGLHLKAGCQTLDGAQALGYVRTRHLFGNQDLQRVQDQRVFLRALLTKMTSPGTLLNPFASIPAAFGATGALTVDQGTHLYQLMEVAFALRHPQTTTVPIASSTFVANAGDVLIWDHTKALELFNAMKNDERVPKSLLTGSKAG